MPPVDREPIPYYLILSPCTVISATIKKFLMYEKLRTADSVLTPILISFINRCRTETKYLSRTIYLGYATSTAYASSVDVFCRYTNTYFKNEFFLLCSSYVKHTTSVAAHYTLNYAHRPRQKST